MITQTHNDSMLSSNLSRVSLENTPVNYQKQTANNPNLNEQLIRTTRSEGAILAFDSLQSTHNRRGFEIDTETLFNHYNRIRLVSLMMSLNIPNINKYNNNVVINYKNLISQLSGSIDVNLDIGYYTIESFLTELSSKINNASLSIPDVSTRWGVRSSGDRFDFIRTSSDSKNINYNKITMLSPHIINNDFDINFDSNCSFIKYGKNLCYFDPNTIINLNPAGQSTQFLMSGLAHLIYTRYISIRSFRLTEAQKIESFDGKNSRRELVAIVSIGNSILQSQYRILTTESDIVILSRGSEFRKVLIEIYDEFDNLLDFGYASDGTMFDNQCRLEFISHD